MNESEMVEILQVLLEGNVAERLFRDEFGQKISRTHRFEDVDTTTTDKGLVIRLTDGSDFELKVVRTRASQSRKGG